ncbi:MAG: SMP-30/gluconolactonase/LRE family protein [Planctomycetaceae bacterium]
MTDIRVADVLFRPETEALRFLPEGPYHTTRSGELSWVAIQHGKTSRLGSINLLNLETQKNQSFELPGRPGFAFACDDELSFVVGCERSIGRFTPQTGVWNPFCEDVDRGVDNTIINDGVIWEDNLVFGTKDLEFKTKKAGLYLWRGSDRSLIALRNDQICSNGKAIRETAAGLELLDIDSPTRQVAAYPLDIAAGTLGKRRVLIDLTDDPAFPDGMILTPDGDGVIVSMFHPGKAAHGEARHYDLATGKLITVWQTPGSPQNTCPQLIALNSRIALVMTTAAENMDDATLAACPNAGCLFIGETDFDRVTPMPIFAA